jgi:large subunit ribosomal protein L28
MIMCDICGKTPQSGHNVSHSKRRTNRRFLPNLQKKKITIAGTTRTLKVCAQCLKTLTKAERVRPVAVAATTETSPTPAPTPKRSKQKKSPSPAEATA